MAAESSAMSRGVSLIACLAPNRGIGAAGTLPWRLKKEMDYFRRVTTHVPSANTQMNAVIMGRRSWESIPPRFRPLKGRLNIVVSRSGAVPDTENAPNTHIASSLDAALKLALSKNDVFRVFIIGGASLYQEALEHAHRLLLTRIKSPEYPECDVFFPQWDSKQFTLRSSNELREWVCTPDSGVTVPDSDSAITEDGVCYTYEMWERNN